MIAHFIMDCKKCGKKEIYMAWHPIWLTRKLCWECREKMYSKHKVWMDKLLEKKKNENSLDLSSS